MKYPELSLLFITIQVLLLSEALSCRGDTLMEVENSLTWLADKCRYIIIQCVNAVYYAPQN